MTSCPESVSKQDFYSSDHPSLFFLVVSISSALSSVSGLPWTRPEKNLLHPQTLLRAVRGSSSKHALEKPLTYFPSIQKGLFLPSRRSGPSTLSQLLRDRAPRHLKQKGVACGCSKVCLAHLGYLPHRKNQCGSSALWFPTPSPCLSLMPH